MEMSFRLNLFLELLILEFWYKYVTDENKSFS